MRAAPRAGDTHPRRLTARPTDAYTRAVIPLDSRGAPSWTLLGLGVAALVLTGCGVGSNSADPAPPASPSPLPAASPSATPSPSPVLPAHPLSGRPVQNPSKPILALKIDNAAGARPHRGLQAADLVFIEAVEGGYNRFIAVYSSTLPREVGPVRSARISDIELLEQFGRVAFGYSGSRTSLRPALAAANTLDVSAWGGPEGWKYAPDRYSPHNLIASPEGLLARAARKGEVATSRDMGWQFDSTPMKRGWQVDSATITYPATKVAFTWDVPRREWLLALDGEPDIDTYTNRQIGATTVIVQIVEQSASQYRDRHGGVTPLQKTVGEGRALFLRDGRAVWGRWSRPQPSDATAFSVAGQPFAMSPGQVWIGLVDSPRAVTTTPESPRPTPEASPSSGVVTSPSPSTTVRAIT